jgi:hypothetical protein
VLVNTTSVPVAGLTVTAKAPVLTIVRCWAEYPLARVTEGLPAVAVNRETAAVVGTATAAAPTARVEIGVKLFRLLTERLELAPILVTRAPDIYNDMNKLNLTIFIPPNNITDNFFHYKIRVNR